MADLARSLDQVLLWAFLVLLALWVLWAAWSVTGVLLDQLAGCVVEAGGWWECLGGGG